MKRRSKDQSTFRNDAGVNKKKALGEVDNSRSKSLKIYFVDKEFKKLEPLSYGVFTGENPTLFHGSSLEPFPQEGEYFLADNGKKFYRVKAIVRKLSRSTRKRTEIFIVVEEKDFV